MYKTIITFLLVLVSLPLIIAQPEGPFTEEVKASIKARIDAGVNTGIVVGVLDANGTHFFSHGIKSMETNEPVDENSVFEIGSISKTFTCTMLAKRVVDGKMKLDDPLQKYLPEGIKAPSRNGQEITLRGMANHTSALPRMPSNFDPSDMANPYADYTEELLYDFLTSHELTRDIGAQFEYSNYAMGLLGYTLARQSQMTYEEMLIKDILDPLDMQHTRVVFTPEMEKQLAKGHSNYQEVSNWDLATLSGAGAIRSTAADMLKYLAANLGQNKSSKHASLYRAMELAHKNSMPNDELPEVGLSWFIHSDSIQIIEHGGATGGYRAFAGFVKGEDKAVVVLTNADRGIEDLGMHLLNPAKELKAVKRPIAYELRKIIDDKGLEAGLKAYDQFKKEAEEEYDFGEDELNSLGYHYLGNKEMDKAIAIFKLNIKAYPKASNPYDSMGEAYMENGEKEKAIANYKKSVELNPGNANGIEMLKKLGVDTDNLIKEVKVADEKLKSYVGNYQLAPGFFIEVTHEAEGLFVQATGQGKFPVFPKSDTVFYLKVVQAEIEFYPSDNGQVDKMTLFQNGQEMPGTRVTE